MSNVARDVLEAERLERAIKLRVRGAHWDEIARACGFPSPASALRVVGDAMAAATRRAEETADSMRDTANLRLESLLRSTLDMMDEAAPETYDNEGNPTGPADDRAVKLRAVDEARRLVGDLAKLNGIATPPKDDEANKIPTVRIIGIDPSELV